MRVFGLGVALFVRGSNDNLEHFARALDELKNSIQADLVAQSTPLQIPKFKGGSPRERGIKPIAWLADQQNAFVTYDESKNIFQIRVLSQYSNTCFIHGSRNCYILQALCDVRNVEQFNTIYKKFLMNDDSYDLFREAQGIPKGYSPGGYGLVPLTDGRLMALAKKKILPVDHYGFLCNCTVNFDFSDPSKLLPEYLKKVKEVYPDISDDEGMYVALLRKNRASIERLQTFLYLMGQRKDFACGVFVGSDIHQMCMVVAKYENIPFCLFADSLNSSYKYGNVRYIVELIYRLATEPAYGKKILERIKKAFGDEVYEYPSLPFIRLASEPDYFYLKNYLLCPDERENSLIVRSTFYLEKIKGEENPLKRLILYNELSNKSMAADWAKTNSGTALEKILKNVKNDKVEEPTNSFDCKASTKGNFELVVVSFTGEKYQGLSAGRFVQRVTAKQKEKGCEVYYVGDDRLRDGV